ncbi:hypothetical protein [Bradyrhizobium sp. BR 1433]|uniref:hypothetical protein n=1 Tax=Bradyrhizobium sp. BR 1433 TaxID=3447967 RepID=UPI003EE4C8BD
MIEFANHTSDVLLIDPRKPLAPRTRYTARTAYTPNSAYSEWGVHFLAPEDVTDAEALRIALGPVEHFNRSWISIEEEHEIRARLASLEEVAPADAMIAQIEERFPNWRSFRDLADCIDCTLHALRQS